jgi:membrane protein implicated in regulation of membrane protease activity
MDLWVLWIIMGLVLVIVELVTGTFYLLVLGGGAFAAAATAWAGAGHLLQAIVGGLAAIGGAWYVHHWHEAHRKADEGNSNFLDRGQAVVMEGWTNEAAGVARVKYRGASWDARVAAGAARPTPGSTLYIDAQDGQMLVVVDAPINK